MEKHRKVSGLITRSGAKRGAVALVAAVSVDSPFLWALGHIEESCTFTGCVVEPPRPHKSELPGAANSGSDVTNRGKGTHVEVTANEVDLVLVHVPM